MYTIIDNIMGEHQAIRAYLRSIKELIKDWGIVLVQNQSFGITVQVEIIAEKKQKNFIQAMYYLEDGLREHHTHEEAAMLPLVGNLLIEAIRLEHKEILGKLGKVKALLVNADASALIVDKEQLVKAVDSLCQLVGEHTLKEDTMLQLQKCLDTQSTDLGSVRAGFSGALERGKSSCLTLPQI